MKRRDFVKNACRYTGAIGVASMSGLLLEACRSRGSKLSATGADPASGVPAASRVRMSITDPRNALNVESYIQAVSAMKATKFPLAVNGKTVNWWEAHAWIHQNDCPHGNWFFLPWHRAYLTYFEKVCQKFSGNPNFALPYWNWTADGHVPAQFMEAQIQGSKNPLFETRVARKSDAIGDEFVGKATIDSILASNDYFSFGSGASFTTQPTDPNEGGSGALERIPHNRTHVFVGGVMGRMLSPMDPVFWLHHCNVDRLWATWEQIQKNAGRNALPNDPIRVRGARALTVNKWLSTQVGTFYEIDSGPDAGSFTAKTVSMAVRDTIDFTGLGYSYDTVLASATQGASLAQSSVQSYKPVEVVDLATSVKVPGKQNSLPGQRPGTILSRMDVTIQRDAAADSVMSHVWNVMNDPNRAKNLIVRMIAEQVYIPKDPNAVLRFYLNIGGTVPTVASPAYLGSYNVFGHQEHSNVNHDVKAALIFDLNGPFKKMKDSFSDAFKAGSPLIVSVFIESEFELKASDLDKVDDIKLHIEFEEPN